MKNALTCCLSLVLLSPAFDCLSQNRTSKDDVVCRQIDWSWLDIEYGVIHEAETNRNYYSPLFPEELESLDGQWIRITGYYSYHERHDTRAAAHLVKPFVLDTMMLYSFRKPVATIEITSFLNPFEAECDHCEVMVSGKLKLNSDPEKHGSFLLQEALVVPQAANASLNSAVDVVRPITWEELGVKFIDVYIDEFDAYYWQPEFTERHLALDGQLIVIEAHVQYLGEIDGESWYIASRHSGNPFSCWSGLDPDGAIDLRSDDIKRHLAKDGSRLRKYLVQGRLRLNEEDYTQMNYILQEVVVSELKE